MTVRAHFDMAKRSPARPDCRRSTLAAPPNSWVAFVVREALGCDASAYMNHHFTADELGGKPPPDQHWHEHATCFRLGDRGLVVISSCGHAGIVNTLRRAQEITGIDKIFVLVGGFHLAPRRTTIYDRSWRN